MSSHRLCLFRADMTLTMEVRLYFIVIFELLCVPLAKSEFLFKIKYLYNINSEWWNDSCQLDAGSRKRTDFWLTKPDSFIYLRVKDENKLLKNTLFLWLRTRKSACSFVSSKNSGLTQPYHQHSMVTKVTRRRSYGGLWQPTGKYIQKIPEKA